MTGMDMGMATRLVRVLHSAWVVMMAVIAVLVTAQEILPQDRFDVPVAFVLAAFGVLIIVDRSPVPRLAPPM